MQPISTDDELRAHWVLSDAALDLLRGISEQRQLTLCVYNASISNSLHGFPGCTMLFREILEFLASQAGNTIDTRVKIRGVPDRMAQCYKGPDRHIPCHQAFR